jgi:endoglucanase
VFRAGAPGSLISPNLAGRDAAALAECDQVFKTSDPAFATRCLNAAEHIFALANTSPSGNLLTVIPYSFYPETEWRDDLEWGATELYLATGSLTYLQQAARWANAYITGPGDAADTLNLYDTSGLAHYDLYRAISQAGNPSGLEVTQAALLADLKKQLDGALAQGATDAFGFGFPWAAFDTTSHGFGLAVMASEYDQLSGTTTYAAQGTRWIGNVRKCLGRLAGCRRRNHLPALHAAPGRQPDRLAGRHTADPGRGGGGGPEQGRLQRPGVRYAPLPGGRRGRVRAVQLDCHLLGQRAVMVDG